METFLTLAELVREHYVLPDVADDYADAIRAHAPDLTSRLPDAAAVNDLLHRIVPDRHLSLRREGPAAPPPAPRAGGVTRVEQLGHACLVELSPLFAGPAEAAPFLRAAAELAGAAGTLLLDLRRCGGGDTDTAALIHGWLLGPEPVMLGRFEHRGRPSLPYVSDPGLGAHFTGDVLVLTSAATFSGGEDLAYVLQAHGRARVVGERTGGGAHPVEHFPLPGGRTAQIPVARSVIDATGGNWEGVGVTPDVDCPAERAMSTARRLLA